MTTERSTSGATPAAQRARRTLSILFGVILGSALGLVCFSLVAAFYFRNSLPVFGREQFEAAKSRWSANGPASYDIEIVVTGRQAATYAVNVRDGQAESASRNGHPLKQRRTFGTWSVPGMFSTIASDVENIEKFAANPDDPQIPQLIIRGAFHPELGYPERYHRTEKIKRGSNRELSWVVSKFEIVRE